MKDKYIDELNNIHADSSYKQHLIQQMNHFHFSKNKNYKIILYASLGCICTCLIIMSVFNIKTYQEVEGIRKELHKYYEINELKLESFMQRNYTNTKTSTPMYSNFMEYTGMGEGGDMFPAMLASQLDTTDSIILDESNKYQELPISKDKSHVFTIKEKKEILFQLIQHYNIQSYQFMANENYLTILSDRYSCEVKGDSVAIVIKDEIEYENIETFVNELIESNPIIFENKTYDKIISEFENENKIIVSLYEEKDQNLENIANARQEINITIQKGNQTTILIRFLHDYEAIYYPCISYQQAVLQLQKEEYYYQQGMKDYGDINKIYFAKLCYMLDMSSNTWLPYYQFYIGVKNLDLAEERGFIVEKENEYVLSVYVCAIGEEEIPHKNDYEFDLIGGN